MPLGFIFIFKSRTAKDHILTVQGTQKLVNSQGWVHQPSSSCVAGSELCVAHDNPTPYLPHAQALASHLISLSQRFMGKMQVTVTPNEIFFIWTHCVHLQLMSSSYQKHQLLRPHLLSRWAALVTAYGVPSAVSKTLDSLLYQGPQPMQSSVVIAEHSCSGDLMPLKRSLEVPCPLNKRGSKSLQQHVHNTVNIHPEHLSAANAQVTLMFQKVTLFAKSGFSTV